MTTSPILGKSVHDILQVRGKTKKLLVGDTHVAAIVGSQPMRDRKVVVLYNNSVDPVEYCFDTDTPYGEGIPLRHREQEVLAVGERVTVYLIADTGVTVDVRIIEGY